MTQAPGRAQLDTWVRALIGGWGHLDFGDGERGAEAAARALASALLPKTLADLDVRRLVVVPDGPLARIPFSALPLGAGVVADRHAVMEVSSVSVLAALRARNRRRSASSLVAVLADPVFDRGDPRLPIETSPPPSPGSTLRGGDFARLPATAREATAIARVSAEGTEVAVALGFDASRERLAEVAPHARILHLATHAVLDDREPMLSGVLLSRVDDRGAALDGFVRLHEIYDLEVGAELVVLSACATADGRGLRGEGRMGLARGFLAAGAGAVVATLWPVDDRAAAAMMASFYQALLVDGSPPSDALAAAQNALRHRGRFRHPSYWAGYVLHGDGSRPLGFARDEPAR